MAISVPRKGTQFSAQLIRTPTEMRDVSRQHGEPLFMRRISKRKHALAAGTIINKVVSFQLLGCECPVDVALSSCQCCDLRGFTPQRIFSQGWNHPPVARTDVFGYVHPGTKDLLWGRFFHLSSRHWDTSQEGAFRKLLFSICLLTYR